MTIAVLAAFLISTLQLPMALADESVVGVVYKDWTEQECKQSLGNRPEITTKTVIEAMGLDKAFLQYKGPLFYNTQETGCYCGKDSNGRQTVLSADKKSCVPCSVATGDKNTLYYNDDKAVNDPKAVIKVKNQDIGCRCAKQEGNKDFDSVVNNACVYADRSAQKAACQAQFGSTGVRICTGLTTEIPLGAVTSGGQTVSCCCEPGFKKEAGTTPSGFQCVKGLGTGSAGDTFCAQIAQSNPQKYGELVQCAPSVVPKAYGGQYDFATANAAQKQEYERTFVGNYGTYACCCPKDYVKDSTGKCVKELDDCGKIISNSVVSTKADADTTMPITSSYNYDGKGWDPAKLKQINDARLQCYCRTDSIPYDNKGQYLVECKPGVKEKDVVFLGKTPAAFAKMFEADEGFIKEWFLEYEATGDYNKGFPIFNYVRANSGEQKRAIFFKEVNEGPYKGGIIITESGSLDFYNKDVSRWGKVWAEGAVVATEMVLGLGAIKQSAKYATKAVTQVSKEAVEEAVERGAKSAATLTSEAVTRVAKTSADDVLAKAVAASPDILRLRGSGLVSKALQTRAPGQSLSEALGFTDDALEAVAKRYGKTLEQFKNELNFYDSYPQATKEAIELAVGEANYWTDAYTLSSGISETTIRRTLLGGTVGLAREGFYALGNGIGSLLVSSAEAIGGAFKNKAVQMVAYFGAPLFGAYADELIPSQTAAISKKWVTGISGALSGAFIGAAAASWTGPGAIVGALIGSVVGAGAYLLADSADKTEMLINWNGQKQAETWNLVMSNNMDNCGKLTDGSGLKFIDHNYMGGTIDGWAMSNLIYAAKDCPLWKRGGDFMIADVLPIGTKVKCTGCYTISPGSMCGQKSTQWAGNAKIISNSGSQVICCSECIRIEDQIAEYYNMPVSTTTGTTTPGSTLSIG